MRVDKMVLWLHIEINEIPYTMNVSETQGGEAPITPHRVCSCAPKGTDVAVHGCFYAYIPSMGHTWLEYHDERLHLRSLMDPYQTASPTQQVARTTLPILPDSMGTSTTAVRGRIPRESVQRFLTCKGQHRGKRQVPWPGSGAGPKCIS